MREEEETEGRVEREGCRNREKGKEGNERRK